MPKRFLFLFFVAWAVLGILPSAWSYQNYDGDMVMKCRIIEIVKPGQRESNRFIIRGYSKRGRVIETFRSIDGRPFYGRSEAELGLFLLVEEGSCPP